MKVLITVRVPNITIEIVRNGKRLIVVPNSKFDAPIESEELTDSIIDLNSIGHISYITINNTPIVESTNNSSDTQSSRKRRSRNRARSESDQVSSEDKTSEEVKSEDTSNVEN